ncbi:3-hydroxy-3-methylglutaryl-CoA reductase, partial [Staphylococcus aureus]|nr:3-hydroxy-3-methylglutaryl-CoA reductase [Staphylococcus aureus]
MQNLDKNFRHLSRKEKLQQLVDKQWLSEEQFDILLNHPLIDKEVA